VNLVVNSLQKEYDTPVSYLLAKTLGKTRR